MANMSNFVNTPILLHGIGKGVFKTVSGKVLECSTAQSMKLNVTTSTEDVYAGDSLFPMYTYISSKEGSIEIQNADFKLSQLSMAQGSKVTTKNNKRCNRVFITKDSTKISEDALTGVNVIAMIAPDGSNVDVATTAGDNVISVTDTGIVAFGASVAAQEGEYIVYYYADEENAVSAEMLKNAMPEVASFTWMFVSEDSEGNRYQIDIFARRTRSNGEFAIETARDSASTPTLTVKILDPGDGKDDFAKITITKLS